MDSPAPRDVMDGLFVTPLQTGPALRAQDRDYNADVLIANAQFLGSYSWANKISPTIIIPGCPPKCRDQPSQDEVNSRPSLNRDILRCPTTPLLPLFIAVDEFAELHERGFEWESIDFVTDWTDLQTLFRWTSGRSKQTFRIDTQLAGDNTVLFSPWQYPSSETLAGKTHRLDVPEASTLYEESTGFCTIVRCNLGGFNIVVRCHCCHEDAYVIPPGLKNPQRNDSHNFLAGTQVGVKFAQSSGFATSSRLSNITVIHAEPARRRLSVVGPATHFRHAPATPCNPRQLRSDLAPARVSRKEHENSLLLERCDHKLVSAGLGRLSVGVQVDFKKLRRLLVAIRDLVLNRGGRGRLSLVSQNGHLGVYQRISQDSCLPEDVLKRFNS